MAMLKIKKGDTVKVITGKDKGKEGKVLSIKEGKVGVEGPRPRRAWPPCASAAAWASPPSSRSAENRGLIWTTRHFTKRNSPPLKWTPVSSKVCTTSSSTPSGPTGNAPRSLAMPSAAENICDIWGITREELDAFAASSQQKTEAAQKAGKFEDEIVPVMIKKKKEMAWDPRRRGPS